MTEPLDNNGVAVDAIMNAVKFLEFRGIDRRIICTALIIQWAALGGRQYLATDHPFYKAPEKE